MAVRSAVITTPQRGIVKVQWSGLLNGDQGDAQDISRYPDMTVQVEGTFGAGGSISVEGRNNGSNFRTLNDSRGEGNALTFTAADLREVLEGNVGGIRPNVTAGDGTTNLTVTIIGTTPR